MVNLLKRLYLKFIVGSDDLGRYWNQRWKLRLQMDKPVTRTMLFHVWLEELMREHGCHSVLEVGCGAYGQRWRNLAGYLGVDFSLEAVKMSRPCLYADVSEGLPLPDKCFDMVCCQAVLLHIPEDRVLVAVREMVRVARKLIVLDEPCNVRSSQPHCFTHDLELLFNRQPFDGEIVFYEGSSG